MIARWERGYRAPLFLVTNFELPDEAIYWYKKRFQIETFFSDEKSRGFYLHKSHLSDPERLSTLMIAACLAYLWIVYLGWSLSETIGSKSFIAQIAVIGACSAWVWLCSIIS